MKRCLIILILTTLFAGGGCQLMTGAKDSVVQSYHTTIADYQHVTNGTESPEIHGPKPYHP